MREEWAAGRVGLGPGQEARPTSAGGEGGGNGCRFSSMWGCGVGS